jgi:hypothetical protein
MSVQRNVFAVVAGYAVVVALTAAGVAALGLVNAECARTERATDCTPLFSTVFLNLLVGASSAVAGGYVTERLAHESSRPSATAAALAGLVLSLGVVDGWAAAWQGREPSWYLALLPVVASLAVIEGGRLGTCCRQTR